jgi:hypothetical protein
MVCVVVVVRAGVVVEIFGFAERSNKLMLKVERKTAVDELLYFLGRLKICK